MGALIRLAAPTPASANASRVYYAVGRALTAADFAREDSYTDDRLLGVMPAVTGVITGLDVAYDNIRNALTVGIGYGIGSNGRVVRVSAPITIAWPDLVAAVTNGGALNDGAYLLLARTATFDGLDGPPPDPALRADPDPLLDIRQDSFVEIWLSSSIGTPAPVQTPADLALALNLLVGGMTPTSLAAAAGSGIPLAVLLQQTRTGSTAITVSAAAGRLPAQTSALNAMLMAQMREAIAAALTEANANPASAAWQTALSARFRYLPPCGELPVGMLLQANSCPFFPPGMEVYLQFIRAGQASHLLFQALDRPRIDLDAGNAAAVTLSLAVPDADWTPDLIDVPRGDPVLAADLHLAYARARAAQVTAREAWIALYGGISATLAAQAPALAFLMNADAAAQDLFYLLSGGQLQRTDLLNAADMAASPGNLVPWLVTQVTTLSNVSPPPPVPISTLAVATAAQQFTALGYQTIDAEPVQADPSQSPHVPAASDDVLAPLLTALPANSKFADWTAAIQATAPDPALLQPLIDAGLFDANADAATREAAITALLALPATTGGGPNDDTQPGALLSLATLQLYYTTFARITRSQELLLEAHDRMIALQRQHLDMMSTYVSALAGGVPSDGTGLSFTRIIPFFDLVPSPASATPTAAQPAGAAPAATQARLLTAAAINTAVSGPSLAARTAASAASAAARSLQSSSIPLVERSNGTQTVAPGASTIIDRLGSSGDIAREVASQSNALAQAPPFSYQPVEYGLAAHITSGSTLLQIANTGLTALRNLMSSSLSIQAPPLPTPIPTSGGVDEETANYAGIVAATRGLLGDIAQVETQAIALENAYFQFRDRLQSLEVRIAQQTAAVAAARDTLRTALSAAAQSAGDYAAAQQLVAEETARVAAAANARNDAIAAATGLFFERELLTRTTRSLPPAIALSADTPDDLVPGCPIDHPGPPQAMQPFLNLLLEVPLNDWQALSGGWTGLPDQTGLQRLGTTRAVRLANWTLPAAPGTGGSVATDLADLAQVTRNAFDPLFASTVPIQASLAATQRAAFGVLALPDIVTLPVSQLRTDGEALRARVEGAAGCLFDTLTGLPPSVRFALASLAQAKTLPLLNFAQWPLPPALGGAATATVRRLSALVDWISGQLNDGASAAGQTALGNLVAAAVIAAAYGDPNEAITGTVATTGGVPVPGVPIRVVLNRTPPIGTVLNLLNDTQSVVGTIRVTDQDTTGTMAEVVTSYARTAPTSGWSVAAPQGRAPWLPS
jgi:hypothetical protein